VIRAWCFREGVEAPKTLPIEAIAERAREPSCLVWVDCDDPEPRDVDLVASWLNIHHLTAEDLAKAQQRTKLERYGDHHHVALHDLALVDDALVAREVDVVFGDGWLLSVRHGAGSHPPLPIDDAFARFDRQRDETGSNDEGFVLWAILDVIVDRYFLVNDAIDERLDRIEDIVFEDVGAAIPREMFALRRALVAYRRSVGPLREVLAALLRREVPGIGPAALTHLQDVYDHVLRILDMVEVQRELLTGLLEGQLAVQSNRMNRVMKATSSWGAILIVATLIAGIYGMNFRHMPELDWRLGYPLALGLMVVTTAILYRLFKRRDWL
jgi:magnesium transporter